MSTLIPLNSHEVTTTISVENTYVDIEVEVDLREEVAGMCSVSVEKEVSFDGCDIIEAYMDDAGTKDPVFFLAKVTQLLFDNAERKVRNDALAKDEERCVKRSEESDQKVACMAEERDSAMAQRDAARHISAGYDKQYNAMQKRVFALTDVLQGIHDNPFEGTINSACSKAIEEHGLSVDK